MTIVTKPDTRLKEQLIKRETARLSTRLKSASTLKNLLIRIPKVATAEIPTAVKALMDAADEYTASQLLINVDGRHSKPGIADARASLLDLHKTVCKAEAQYFNLPINAITTVANIHESTLFSLKPDFENILLSIETARYLLLSEPDKPVNIDRNILAYQVAVVFRDILKVTPTSTRAKQLKIINARGGAAYDRVLRATLKVAGVNNYDSEPLIAAGLRLLKDLDLP